MTAIVDHLDMMQDESAIRGSVRTVHTVSEDGESCTDTCTGTKMPCKVSTCCTHAEQESLHVSRSPAPSQVDRSPRAKVCIAGLDAQSVMQKFGKGKPIPAIIEAVSSGASLKATLLPDQYFVSVMLVGIVCPSFNRRPTGQSAAAPATNGIAPAPKAATEAAEPATNGNAGAACSLTCTCHRFALLCQCYGTRCTGVAISVTFVCCCQ